MPPSSEKITVRPPALEAKVRAEEASKFWTGGGLVKSGTGSFSARSKPGERIETGAAPLDFVASAEETTAVQDPFREQTVAYGPGKGDLVPDATIFHMSPKEREILFGTIDAAASVTSIFAGPGALVAAAYAKGAFRTGDSLRTDVHAGIFDAMGPARHLPAAFGIGVYSPIQVRSPNHLRLSAPEGHASRMARDFRLWAEGQGAEWKASETAIEDPKSGAKTFVVEVKRGEETVTLEIETRAEGTDTLYAPKAADLRRSAEEIRREMGTLAREIAPTLKHELARSKRPDFNPVNPPKSYRDALRAESAIREFRTIAGPVQKSIALNERRIREIRDQGPPTLDQHREIERLEGENLYNMERLALLVDVARGFRPVAEARDRAHQEARHKTYSPFPMEP